MEHTKRLHPLMTMAAISLTIFSAVGVAALTGLMPNSKGSAQDSALELPKEVIAPVAPAIAHPVVEQPAQPAPKTKPVVKAKAKTPVPASPVVYRDFDETPAPVAQAPLPQAQEAPRPVAQAGVTGTVESVREVEVQGKTKGIGAAAGAGAGMVLGNKLGDGKNKLIWTVLGGVGGGFAGNEIEKHQRKEKQWELNVRLDNGTNRTFNSTSAPHWRAGDRVRLLDGKLQPV